MILNDKKHQIDLNAKIVPGQSAAGFTLGTKKNDIEKQVLDSFEFIEIHSKHSSNFPPLHEYRTTSLILHFNQDLLTQIRLIGNYKGKLEANLGLGDLVKDFELHYGQMTEGDEDELIFTNLKGMCFEVDDSKYNSDNWKSEIPNLPVTEIFIFNK